MILITGGAGFIGSNYAHFIGKKEDVVICDELGASHKWKNLRNINLADIISPSEALDWLKRHKISCLIHLGAVSTTVESNVDHLLHHNFTFSKHLWNWCREKQIRFIYASSAATYGDGTQGFKEDCSPEALTKLKPLNAYGWSKNIFDIWAVTQSMKGNHPPQWAGLKFFNVYGPRETHKESQRSVIHQFFEQMNRGQSLQLFKSYHPTYGDGEQQRDFIFVEDCCEVINWFRQIPSFSGIFNVGTGKGRSFLDLTKALGAAMAKEPQVDFIDMPPQIAHHYQYFTQADMENLYNTGYKKDFISLEEGVKKYVSFLKENPDFYTA